MTRTTLFFAAMLLAASTLFASDHPVHLAVSKRATFDSCRNKGIIQIIDKKTKFKLGVNVEIHAHKKGMLKIRATKASVKAYTILMTDKDVSFYLPREKKLFVGTPEQFARGMGLFSPEEMLGLILRGHPQFKDYKWKPLNEANKYELITQKGTDTLRVELDRNGELARVEYVLGTGEIIRTIDYGAYMSVRQQGVRRSFPRLIRITWPTDDRHVTVKLRGVEENPRTNEETWSIRMPMGIEKLPLARLQIKGDE